MPHVIVILMAFGLLSVAKHASAAEPGIDPATLEQRVARFCRDHVGQKVGSGECSSLAYQALKAAGAKPRCHPDHPNHGDYVWGKEVYLLESGLDGGTKATGKLASVRPGDIIQFRDTTWGKEGSAQHHTAVVAAVDIKAHTIRVYEQHTNHAQIVVDGTLKLHHLTSGWIRIYRPVPQDR